MKKRDLSLDVIRIIAIFMIVVFHFAVTYVGSDRIFLFNANGSWGNLGTALFFILSGYLLRIRYKDIESIKKFYFKRWLSIYPAYYIAFIVAFLVNVIRLKRFFYQGPGYSLIYSVLGVDNYLVWFDVQTYATVGEWFTAVIVILYLAFPFFNKVVNRYRWSATVIYTIFYIIYVHYGLYPKLAEISFVACGYMFWIGMMIAEHEKILRKNYLNGVATLAITIVLLFVKINITETFAVHILAVMMFASVIILLKGLSGNGKGAKCLTYLSEISYAVYLVHHYILNDMFLGEQRYHILNSICLPLKFVIYLIVVIISASVLEFVTRKLVMLCLNGSK